MNIITVKREIGAAVRVNSAAGGGFNNTLLVRSLLETAWLLLAEESAREDHVLHDLMFDYRLSANTAQMYVTVASLWDGVYA